VKLLAPIVASVLVVGCAQSTLPDEPAIDTSVTSVEVETRCATNPVDEVVGELTVVTNSGPQAAPYILWADEMACFEENGVSVTLVQAGAPSDRIANLMSGAADVAWLPNDPLLAGVVNAGIDMVVVAPHVGSSSERINEARSAREFDGSLLLDGVALAAPGRDFSDWKELEGKKFGRQSSISNIGAEIALQEAGVNVENVQWVDIEQAERLNSLLRGDLDAVVLSGPNALKALRGGATFLFYYQAWDRSGGVDNYWVTTPAAVEAKKELLLKFRQGMWDAYRLLGDPAMERQYFQYSMDVLEGEPEDAQALRLPDFFLRPADIDELESHMEIMFTRGDVDRVIDLSETSLFVLDAP
jgi:ABC-type nitrate/sulfonate/bicarbonate transport system substrate-binding protein